VWGEAIRHLSQDTHCPDRDTSSALPLPAQGQISRGLLEDGDGGGMVEASECWKAGGKGGQEDRRTGGQEGRGRVAVAREGLQQFRL
jgi:hypothetical protein